MRILRIEVRHWRGLSVRVELPAGGVLLEGPNEVGKSRLLEALVFALTESARGMARYKERLLTHGSQERPFVCLRFEHAGGLWEVRKRFCTGRNEVWLLEERRGEEWSGDRADSRLAELLWVRSDHTKRRGPGLHGGAEGLGPWPLLVVPQRRGHALPTASRERGGLPEDVYVQLRERLRTELGDAIAGVRGEVVLRRLRERFEPLAPDQRRSQPGRPVGRKKTPLGDAQERFDRALEDYRTAWKAWSDAQALDRRIAEASERLVVLRREQREASARRAALEERLGALAAAKDAAAEAERARAEAMARCRAAEEALARRRELERTLAERQEQRTVLEERLRALRGLRGQLEEASRRAEAERRRLRDVVRSVRRRLDALEETRRRRARREELLRKERMLRGAEEGLEALRQAEAVLAELSRYTIRRRRCLMDRIDAIREAEAALRREAVQVSLTARRGGLHVGGEVLAVGEPVALHVLDRQVWTLCDERGDLVTVEVARRSAGADALRVALEAAREGFERLARDLDLPGEPEAALRRFEVLSERREEAERLRALARDRLAALLGIEAAGARGAFEELIEALRADVVELRRALGDLEDPASAERPEVGGVQDAESLRAELRSAEEALERADEEVERLRAEEDGIRERERQERERLEGCEELDVRGPEAKLDVLPAFERLEVELAEAQRELAAREAELAEAQRELAALQGDRLEAERDALSRSVERLEAEIARHVERRHHLLGERSRVVGEGDLQGPVVERGAVLLDAARALRRERARVLALQRLLSDLVDRRRRAERKVFGPLLSELRGTVRQVFGPDSRLDIVLSERAHGRPDVVLRRGDRALSHELLSAGAQEQLALMVRVALARLWHRELSEGETLPLLLDDPLSETDEERLPQVAKLLADAVREGLQVLIFTCRAAPYLRGAPGFTRLRLEPDALVPDDAMG